MATREMLHGGPCCQGPTPKQMTDAEVLEWLPLAAQKAWHKAERCICGHPLSAHSGLGKGCRYYVVGGYKGTDGPETCVCVGYCAFSPDTLNLCRELAETRKALAESMESHKKLAVWPKSCLDWPDSALDEIGKMKETAGNQWLEDERLLKGEQS